MKDRITRIRQMKFSSVYPLYINKAERKGRTRLEVNTIIQWLTGYDEEGIVQQIQSENSFEIFFNSCPQLNPNAALIKGVICGYRIEEIEDPIERQVRYLDKLIDELAKGKSIEKIFRQ